MRYTLPLLLAGTLLAAIACTDGSARRPSPDPVARTASVTTPGTGPWARVVEGETGPGHSTPCTSRQTGTATRSTTRTVSGRRSIRSRSTIRTTSSRCVTRLAHSVMPSPIRASPRTAWRSRTAYSGRTSSEDSSTPSSRRSRAAAIWPATPSAHSSQSSWPSGSPGSTTVCWRCAGWSEEHRRAPVHRRRSSAVECLFPGVLPGSPVFIPTPMTLPQVQAAGDWRNPGPIRWGQ